MTRRRKKIVAIASGGGHWVELLRLRPAFEGHFVVFVTVNEAYRAHVGDAPLRVIRDVTRWDRLGLVEAAAQITRSGKPAASAPLIIAPVWKP